VRKDALSKPSTVMHTILMTGVEWKSFVKSIYLQTTNNSDAKGLTNGIAFKTADLPPQVGITGQQ